MLVVFGSELKCVLASGLVDAELDYDAIDAYLTLGFVPGAADPARRRPQAPARAPARRRRRRASATSSYWELPGPAPDARDAREEYAERAARRSSTSPSGCA